MLKAGMAGLGGISLPMLLQSQAQARSESRTSSTGKSVILLWMAGGPSHIDTWDSKPERPWINRGPFGVTQTKLPGVVICEHLPKQAAMLDATIADWTRGRTVTEALEILDAAEAVTGVRPDPIGHITWHDAMNRFGVDKPDLRFGMELRDLTDVFAATEFKAFAGAAAIKGINANGKADEYGRNKLDAMTEKAKKMGAKGLVWLKVAADGSFESPVAKFLSEAETAALRERLSAQPGDLLLIVADNWTTACEVLGVLRNDIGRPPVFEGPYRYLWVVDFPLFVGVDEVTGRPRPGHHPFTQPHPDDLHLMETDPLKVRSQAYDLVLNGWELGSGSIRIHQPELQARIFQLLGISDEEAQKKFGFFLNPFKYGAPPHGGFAFGIDRLVAILAGEDNIREVIAFPKTQSGTDLMSGAPKEVTERQLRDLRLKRPTKG